MDQATTDRDRAIIELVAKQAGPIWQFGFPDFQWNAVRFTAEINNARFLAVAHERDGKRFWLFFTTCKLPVVGMSAWKPVTVAKMLEYRGERLLRAASHSEPQFAGALAEGSAGALSAITRNQFGQTDNDPIERIRAAAEQELAIERIHAADTRRIREFLEAGGTFNLPAGG